jgi:hypothetical protein
MKRFTDTSKWEKEWFCELPPLHKCFWQYICDRCDACGVWEPNYKVASCFIGQSVSVKDLKAFGDRVAVLASGKVLILGFIEFQYGKLSADCKGQTQVFRAIEHHGFEWDAKGIKQSSITYQDSLSDRLSERLLVQDQNRKGEERGSGGKPEQPAVVIPTELNTPEFLAAWERWRKYRKERKKKLSPETEASQMKKLVPFGVQWAITRIDRAIESSWTGLVFDGDQPGALPIYTRQPSSSDPSLDSCFG